MKTVWLLRGITPQRDYILWPEVYESEADAKFERDLAQELAPEGESWQAIELNVLPDSTTLEDW